MKPLKVLLYVFYAFTLLVMFLTFKYLATEYTYSAIEKGTVVEDKSLGL